MRESRAIMADLAMTGLTPEQIALVMELSAAVSAEARPVADDAADRRRERDRRYQAQKRAEHRQMSADSADIQTGPSLSRPLSPQTPLTPTHTHPDITPAREGPSEEHVLAWQEWRKSNPFPRPWWVNSGLWRDFKANRKAKRLPNTVSAHDKLLRDVEAMAARTGWPPGEVFAACVAKGWGAIYDPRETTNDRPKQRPSTTRQPLVDLARAVAADMEREASARAGY